MRIQVQAKNKMTQDAPSRTRTHKRSGIGHNGNKKRVQGHLPRIDNEFYGRGNGWKVSLCLCQDPRTSIIVKDLE